MEHTIDVYQDRDTRNRNRLSPNYRKNDFMIAHGTRFRDDSKPSSNDYSQTNKTNYYNFHQLFIGNLTWWTTDQDIINSMIDVGVYDIVDIQFFENRENGQSKGFCTVTLESEKSLNRILKKLPNELIHRRKPVVTFPSSSAYFMFESKYETRLSVPSIHQNISSKGDMSRISGNSLLQNPSHNMSYHKRMPMMYGYKQTYHQYPQTTGYKNQWNKSYQQNMCKYFVTPKQSPMETDSSLSQMNQSYHYQEAVDPTLFNQTSAPLKYKRYLYDDYHPLYIHSYVPRMTNEIEMTETEINNFINRNRVVSSSAIARAITNAANGEYLSAIETLNIAIALIEDSKIANDERSQILVSTLYNTICGIQNKMVNIIKDLSPTDKLNGRSKRKYS